MARKETKSVLIMGGGVAALSAAAAFVEFNRRNSERHFKVHLVTTGHRWGGRASSWIGGTTGPHVDLKAWPNLTLNHGFHAVFSATTYRNFWHTLREAWNNSYRKPERSLDDLLISNNHEFLIAEARSESKSRIPGKEYVITPLRVHPGLMLPGSHLVGAGLQQSLSGTWTLSELLSFRNIVLREVFRHKTFKELQQVDECSRVPFREWCVSRGLEESVLKKQLFEFILDGSYVAPYEMDTASAIKALWILLRDYRATEWYYLQGGYTAELMDPLYNYLQENGVVATMLYKIEKLIVSESLDRMIQGYEGCRVSDHPDSGQPRRGLPKHEPGRDPHDDYGKCGCVEPMEHPDYYISTLPLPNLWEVVQQSSLENEFPSLDALVRGGRNVGTVNLQAWFQKPNLLGNYKNVIAGFEPLCIAIDYKNILPIYRNDNEWPGTILELNGSEDELMKSHLRRDYQSFADTQVEDSCHHRASIGKQPTSPQRIEYAETILRDFASRYRFTRLKEAVESKAYLKKNGKTIPPFLWFNVHRHNSFFVTSPGRLECRPAIRTSIGNLFLAGDWTRNGLDIPCMEGAARSGRMAAKEIMQIEGCRNSIEVFDPI